MFIDHETTNMTVTEVGAFGEHGKRFEPACACRHLHPFNFWSQIPSLTGGSRFFLWCIPLLKWFQSATELEPLKHAAKAAAAAQPTLQHISLCSTSQSAAHLSLQHVSLCSTSHATAHLTLHHISRHSTSHAAAHFTHISLCSTSYISRYSTSHATAHLSHMSLYSTSHAAAHLTHISLCSTSLSAAHLTLQ